MKLLRRFFNTTTVPQKFSYITDFKNGFALAIPSPASDNDYFSQISIINQKKEVVEHTSYRYFFANADKKVKWWHDYIIAFDDSSETSNDAILLDRDLQKVKGHAYSFISFDMYLDSYIMVIETRNRKEYRGVIDCNLNTVISTNYSNIQYLENQIFATKNSENDVNTKIHDIKQKKETEIKGNIVDKYTYLNIRYYKFYLDGKYGYYDQNFNIYLDAKYQKLGNIDKGGKIPFQKNGRVGVINMITKEEIYR